MSKDIILLSFGRLAQALINIAALRIMTALLSPAEVGGVFVVLSVAGGFAFFLINPVGMYINRKLHSWHGSGTVADNLSVFNIYVSAVSVLSFPVVFFAVKYNMVGASLPAIGLAAMVGGYIFFNTWSMTLIPSLNMLGHRRYFVSLSVLTSVLCLGSSVACVLFFGSGAINWMSGQVLGFGVSAVAALPLFMKLNNDRFAGFISAFKAFGVSPRSELYRFALPLAGATIFMWLQQQGYRLVVEKVSGAAFLGYLAVGLGIAASLGAVVESLIQQICFPGFDETLNVSDAQGRRLALFRLSSRTIPVYVMLGIFTVCFSSQLTAILTHKKFEGVSLYVAFGALLEFFRMTGNILAAGAHSEMRTKALIKPYAAGACVSVLLVYLACFVPGRDLAIPAALCLGGGITLGAIFLKMKALTGVSLPYGDTFKATLLSLPLLMGLMARQQASMAANLFALAAAGAYLAAAGYLFFKPRFSAYGGESGAKAVKK